MYNEVVDALHPRRTLWISQVLKAFILTSQFSSQCTNFMASPGASSHSAKFGMKVLERKVKDWLDRDVDTFHPGVISSSGPQQKEVDL